MPLVKTIGSSFAVLSLLALSSACDAPSTLGPDFAMGEFEYVSSSNIQGDLDRLQDFDGTGEAGVIDEEGYFFVTASAQLPEIRGGMAMTILNYYGETAFNELPAGTVLHASVNNSNTLLDMVDADPGLVIEDAEVDAMLCGGNDEGFEDYWVDIPADEVVVEIEATDDPNVNEVTLTGATENFDTGELDIVTTTFDVQL